MLINSRYITDTKMPEADYATALTNFLAVCNANKVPLALTTNDLTEIQAAATGFPTTLNAWVAAQAAAGNAKTAKDVQKATTATIINKWAKIFRANNAIPDALLDQLMVAPHKPGRTSSPPVTPTEFQCVADGDGNISMKWRRNGNTSATSFVIEWRGSASAPWTQIGATTRAKFSWQSTPGEYAAFRVRATKKGQSSAASNQFVVWNGQPNASLRIAA